MFSSKLSKSTVMVGAALVGFGAATVATQAVFAEPTLTLVGSCTATTDKTYDGTPEIPGDLGYTFEFDVIGASDVQLRNYEVQFADVSGVASRDKGSKLAVTAVTLEGANAGGLELETPVLISQDSAFTGCQAATIVAKDLNILNVQAQDKVYNGDTDAILNRSNPELDGVVAGDTVNLDTEDAKGTFSDKDVADDKTVSTSGFSIDNRNYSLIQPTLTASIEPAGPVTINVTGSKTYGDTSGSFSFNATGLVGSDEVTGASSINVQSDADTTDDADAGTYTITFSSPTGFSGDNYSSVSTPAGTFTVNRFSTTVTANNQSITYGDGLTLDGTEFTHGSLAIAGEDIEYVSFSFDGPFDGTSASANAGTYVDEINASSATGSGGFDAANYYIEYVDGNLTIEKAPLTITSSASRTKDYGNAITLSTSGDITATGTIGSETVTNVDRVSEGEAEFTDVGVYPIEISNATGTGGFLASNYVIDYVSTGNVTVETRDVTITVTDQAKTYGEEVSFGRVDDAYFTVTTMASGESVSHITITGSGARAADDNVGTTGTLVAEQGSEEGTFTASNYNFLYSDGVLSIDKKNASISVIGDSFVYGDSIPTYGTYNNADVDSYVNLSGFVLGEDVTEIVISTNASTGDDVGTYSITLDSFSGTFDANNYTIAESDAVLSVTEKSAAITVELSQTKTYGETLTYGRSESGGGTVFTVSGVLSGDSVDSILLSSDGAIATADANRIEGPSHYDITGSNPLGSGLSNYIFSYTDGSLVVDPAPLTIRSDTSDTKLYGELWDTSGTTSWDIDDPSQLKNGESVTSVLMSSTGAAKTANVLSVGSSYPVVLFDATGANGFDEWNYDITYVPGSLVVQAASLTITAKDTSKVYGEDLVISETNGFTATGLKNGETIAAVDIAASGGLTADSAVIGSPYTLTPSNARGPEIGSSFSTSNYDIEYVAGELTVSPLEISITPSNLSKTVGEEITLGSGQDGFEIDVDPLPNGDTIMSVTLASAGAAEDAAVGIYSLNASSAQGSFVASNYDITYVPGVIDVNAATISGGGGGTIVVQAPVITDSSVTGSSGSEITLSGANLNFVRSVTMDGENATIVSSSATSITILVPTLDEGSASIVLSYLGGQIEYASVFTVEAAGAEEPSDAADPATETNYWTTALSESEIKMYAKNIIGLGKVQFFHNGEEVAWVRAEDATDPKLRVIESGPMQGANYLVRTRTLVPGKNVFEIYVDGVRVERRAQTFESTS